MIDKILKIYNKHKVIFQNFSYITALQIFLMLVPLITYPYLIRVLGKELYGFVITAQVVASYFSIVVDFGFKSVSARHISIHRNDKHKLSEIMSNIMFIRIILWCLSLFLFIIIVYSIDSYREHLLLFLFSYGITFNELLFPQFFFQGVEKMKAITIINIIIRTLFLILIFIFIKTADDYVLVPMFLSLGYLLGGVISIYILIKTYHLSILKPSISKIKYYTKDALPIFYTDIVCTIKDKFSYIIIGQYISMADVPIYDLGAKFVRLLSKPVGIIGTVLFPSIAKDKNLKLFKIGILLSVLVTFILVILTNIFLPTIVSFFIDEQIDLLPIRLFLLAPIFLSVAGFIASNLIIAFNYNKYILYSIIITTIIYCLSLGIFFTFNYVNILSMVIIAVIGYLSELVYRLFVAKQIVEIEKSNL